MNIRVLYHDHCFDGAASAAYFTRFMQGAFYPEASFHYTGMAHKASQIFEDNLFDGDVNAIVDFKYSPNAKLTWWFDHHQSAFLSPEDARHFSLEQNPQKMYDVKFQVVHLSFISDNCAGALQLHRAGSGQSGALGEHYRWRAVPGCADGSRIGSNRR